MGSHRPDAHPGPASCGHVPEPLWAAAAHPGGGCRYPLLRGVWSAWEVVDGACLAPEAWRSRTVPVTAFFQPGSAGSAGAGAWQPGSARGETCPCSWHPGVSWAVGGRWWGWLFGPSGPRESFLAPAGPATEKALPTSSFSAPEAPLLQGSAQRHSLRSGILVSARVLCLPLSPALPPLTMAPRAGGWTPELLDWHALPG